MFAFTPTGRLAFVLSQSDDRAEVLVLETVSVESVAVGDLRPVVASAPAPAA